MLEEKSWLSALYCLDQLEFGQPGWKPFPPLELKRLPLN